MTDFPWGEQNPQDGFKIGDRVGLIYSDHEEYIFDNPVGIVTAVGDSAGDQSDVTLSVVVDASIDASRVYLISRYNGDPRTKFADLPVEVRAEIDAKVHDAYLNADGTTRSHTEAQDEFARILSGQEHQPWVQMLLNGWRQIGMAEFMKDRWKHSAMFEFTHRGKPHRRSVNRGARQIGAEGKVSWTQSPLWEWTADQLRDAIAHATQQVAEHQANIALYRDMLTLIEQTETFTFPDALKVNGKTWEQFLSERGRKAS